MDEYEALTSSPESSHGLFIARTYYTTLTKRLHPNSSGILDPKHLTGRRLRRHVGTLLLSSFLHHVYPLIRGQASQNLFGSMCATRSGPTSRVDRASIIPRHTGTSTPIK